MKCRKCTNRKIGGILLRTLHCGDWANKRMTERHKQITTLLPLNSVDLVGMYRDYNTFYAHLLSTERLCDLEDLLTLKKAEDWNEDDGPCIWWSKDQVENGLPFEEPFYIGSPLSTDFPTDAYYFIGIMVFPNKNK